jgi:aminopeptidase N
VALVPSVAELERWGGGLHDEQRWSEHRVLKATWVLRMIEARIKERDNGRAAVSQLYSRLVPLRLVPEERVLRSTSELFRAIRSEFGLDLGTMEEQWVRASHTPASFPPFGILS